MLYMTPYFFPKESLAGVRCPPNSRPWINVSSGRWGAPRLRAAAPSSCPACRPCLPCHVRQSPSPWQPASRSPSSECGNPRPKIVRARFRAPYSVARCARIISPLSLCGALLPFPRNGVRAPYGRPRPATLTNPAPRVTKYVLTGIVAPFRSPRGQNKAGSKQILLFTSGGIFWAFYLLFIDRCRLFQSRTICLFDLVCIEYRNPCLYADAYRPITLGRRWASAFCHI